MRHSFHRFLSVKISGNESAPFLPCIRGHPWECRLAAVATLTSRECSISGWQAEKSNAWDFRTRRAWATAVRELGTAAWDCCTRLPWNSSMRTAVTHLRNTMAAKTLQLRAQHAKASDVRFTTTDIYLRKGSVRASPGRFSGLAARRNRASNLKPSSLKPSKRKKKVVYKTRRTPSPTKYYDATDNSLLDASTWLQNKLRFPIRAGTTKFRRTGLIALSCTFLGYTTRPTMHNASSTPDFFRARPCLDINNKISAQEFFSPPWLDKKVTAPMTPLPYIAAPASKPDRTRVRNPLLRNSRNSLYPPFLVLWYTHTR